MRETGYREQYDRMLRWLSRLEDIYNASEQPPYTKIETRSEQGVVKVQKTLPLNEEFSRPVEEKWEAERDIVYAFFQNCYHLKDWMYKDNLASKRELQKFCDRNDCLVRCKDLCNGSKHCDLKRGDVSGRTVLVRQNGDIVMRNKYLVLHDRGQWDALDLAKCCVAKWDEFIARHS